MEADYRHFRVAHTRVFRTAAVLIGLCFLSLPGGCGSSSGPGGTGGRDGGGAGTAGIGAGTGGAGAGGVGTGGAAAGRGGTGGAIAGQGGSSGQGGGSAGAAGHGSGGSGGGGIAGAAGSSGGAAGRTAGDGGLDAAAGRTAAGDGSVIDSGAQSCLSSNPDPCACGRPDANTLSATECAEETRCRAAGGIWEPYFVFLPDGGEHGPRCQTASGAVFDAGSG